MAHPTFTTLTKPCIFCDKQLEPALEDWTYMQPSGGGEVQFIFGYGSRKFDLTVEPTVFKGVICDQCASRYIERMTRVGN